MSVSTEADADGRYLIEGLIPGTYHLSSTAAQSQLTTAIMRAVNRSEDTVEISGETKHDIALDTRQPF